MNKKEEKMKVLMLNGSPHRNGCTYTALTEIGETLKKYGIDYEIFQIGNKPIRDCIACNKCDGHGCIFDENLVKEFQQKSIEADGFVFGTPVYFAHPSGAILSFLDRVFYSVSDSEWARKPFEFKPAAAIASARRAGTTASLDVLNKYFTASNMPIVSANYWNMVHGFTADDVRQDKEGMQTMRNIGHNMAWMLKCLALGRQNGIQPHVEVGEITNFIR